MYLNKYIWSNCSELETENTFSVALNCYNKEGEAMLGCLGLYCFELSWANISSIFLPGTE